MYRETHMNVKFYLRIISHYSNEHLSEELVGERCKSTW